MESSRNQTFLLSSQPYRTLPSPHPSPLFVKKGRPLTGTIYPGASSRRTKCTLSHRSRQGSPAREKGRTQGQQQGQRQTLLPLLGNPHDDQGCTFATYVYGSKSRLCMLFGWCFRLRRLPRAQVSLLCRSSGGVVEPSDSLVE